MEIDFASLDTAGNAERGAVLQLVHPGDPDRDPQGGELLHLDGAPITLTLRGRDSRQYEGIVDKQIERNFKAMQGRGKLVLTPAERKEDGFALLKVCTLGWSDSFAVMAGKILKQDKPLEFSPTNADTVYRRIPWIKEQADKFIGDRQNFLLTPSGS
jgi:hypothetical protein